MKLNREAIGNLEQNKCVGTSLKDYAADMLVLTYHAGLVLAAMNGYGMYERICDEDCGIVDSVKEHFVQLCREAQRTVSARCRGMEFQMGCGRLEDLRNRIIQEAQKAEQDSELLEQYASLLEVLNPVYGACLVSAQAGKAEKDVRPCLQLLELIEKAADPEQADASGDASGYLRELEEEAMPFLCRMEGLQERYYQPLYRYQLAFPDIRNGFSGEIEKRGLVKNYEILEKTSKLLSSSPFAPLRKNEEIC